MNLPAKPLRSLRRVFRPELWRGLRVASQIVGNTRLAKTLPRFGHRFLNNFLPPFFTQYAICDTQHAPRNTRSLPTVLGLLISACCLFAAGCEKAACRNEQAQ